MSIEKPLVSIIIPVYNTEIFLEECVKSCVQQDYENLEIILVDDGSTDGSGQLCEQLADKNNRVIVYHKENGGLSDARNYGLNKSQGKYIVFVDSDDMISKTMISILYKELVQNRGDIAVCDLAHFIDGDSPRYGGKWQIDILSSNDAIKEMLYQKKISTSSCGKMYRKSAIGEERFVKGQRFEDNDFLFRVFRKNKFIISVDAKLYGYRHRTKSITTSSFSKSDFDIIEIGKKIINEAKEMDEDVKKAIRSYQCANSLRIYLTVTPKYYNNEKYDYCLKYLKDNAWRVIKDKNSRKKTRVALLIYVVRIPRWILVYIRKHVNRWK